MKLLDISLGQIADALKQPRARLRVQRSLIALALLGALLGAVWPSAAPATAAPAPEPPQSISLRPAQSLSDSLVAYWKLEEASGTRFDELSGCGGSGCDLTDNNTVGQITGHIGNAGQFISVNSEYLSHADDADLDTGDIDFTIALWVYLESKSADMGIYSKWADPSDYQIQYSSALDRYVFYVTSDGSAVAGVAADNFGSPPIATWTLVIAWHDSVNNQIGISVSNGTPNTNGHSAGVFASDSPLVVGAINTSGGFFNGRIDSVGFWKRVLSSTERGYLWNAGAGCDYPFTACEPTATPTITHTATYTPTITLTPTVTPTITDTPTITLTPTVTPTITDTPTITLTPTVTATATDTPTSTVTPTVTHTPTVTNTPTPLPTLPSSACADSFSFPLDNGKVYTVNLCSSVDGIAIGGILIVIVVAAVVVLIFWEARRYL